MINERLTQLRERMKTEKIDAYLMDTSDDHLSEYVPEYFKTLAYFSGFKGSLATLLVMTEDAYLFVDGRYHIAADKQSGIYGIKIVKLGLAGALNPIDFIKENLTGKTVALDGKRASVSFVKKLMKLDIKVKSIDLYSSLIVDRVPLTNGEVKEVGIEYVGESRKEKLAKLIYCLDGKTHIISSLDQIAYLLNLRSDDILYTPVFRSYLLVSNNEVYLFGQLERFSDEALDHLYEDGVIFRDYEDFFDFLRKLRRQTVLIDENKTNYETYLCLHPSNKVVHMRSITEEMRAVKNPTEISNMRQAHIYDGVSMVRFLKWLSETDLKEIDEYDAAEKLNEIRLNNHALDLSFSSIVAYNENSAVVHYAPEKGNAKKLNREGILLVDSGGQYLEGTTDITRTFALGETKEDVKKYFTLVLKSMFNLSDAVVLSGMTPSRIDILARKDLWKQHVNFLHGTGHGIGYYLSVHEGIPNVRFSKGNVEEDPFKPGYVFSDEPGVYFADDFGIRCENQLLCKEECKNEYGTFLSFETLTLCPFDLKLIDKAYLDPHTIDLLNAYHQKVYFTLAPYLNEEERQFLATLTEVIS